MALKKANGFDRLAPVYDFLARAIYGRSIVRAQYSFLSRISPQSNVLILGGGTGWFLAELLRVHPGCSVWYIESSAAMLAKAEKKNHADSRVVFILGTLQDIPDRKFDVVITHFFLDLFSQSTLADVVQRIKSTLSPFGLWLAADFIAQRRWHKTLLKLMYFFFHVVCGIEATTLPPWEAILRTKGIEIEDQREFYGGFIVSLVGRLKRK